MTTDAQARSNGQVLTALTIDDRHALFQAAELVRSVATRHPLEMSGPILLAVQACVHDIDVLGRYLEAAEAAPSQYDREVTTAQREAAERDREWAAGLYSGADPEASR